MLWVWVAMGGPGGNRSDQGSLKSVQVQARDVEKQPRHDRSEFPEFEKFMARTRRLEAGGWRLEAKGLRLEARGETLEAIQSR